MRSVRMSDRFRGTYDSTWTETAMAVKEAAAWRCVRCAHPHDVKSGYVLTVHHLDGNKSNDAWWNLLALCQRCHLKIQARVIPERPWMLEHSAWFVPYVCGFYAHYYGKRNITRAEADAAPNRWLAMGQPWLYEFARATTPEGGTADG